MSKKIGSNVTTSTSTITPSSLGVEPVNGALTWLNGAWAFVSNFVTSDKAFLLKYTFYPDGISDDNGVITGTKTFNLPSNFSYSKTHFARDGGLFANYTVDSTAKTITFSVAPLSVNIVEIFYYPI